MYWIGGAVVLLWIPSQVNGQATTNVVCAAGTDWMGNDRSPSQNPCLVAAYLSAVCYGGQWNVPSLTAVGPYDPPSGNFINKCRCSSPVYTLLSACSYCQRGLIGTWPDWIANCPASDVSVGFYPGAVPDGTSLPAWALVDPTTTSNVWNATQAQLIATSASPSASASAASTPGKKSNVGVIVGAVIGGILGFLVIAGLVFFFIRWRHRPKPDKIIPGTGMGDVGFQVERSHQIDLGSPTPPHISPSLTPGSIMTGLTGSSGKRYDPNDPTSYMASSPPPSMPKRSTSSHGMSPPRSPPSSVSHAPNSSFHGQSFGYAGSPPPVMTVIRTAGSSPPPPPGALRPSIDAKSGWYGAPQI